MTLLRTYGCVSAAAVVHNIKWELIKLEVNLGTCHVVVSFTSHSVLHRLKLCLYNRTYVAATTER